MSLGRKFLTLLHLQICRRNSDRDDEAILGLPSWKWGLLNLLGFVPGRLRSIPEATDEDGEGKWLILGLSCVVWSVPSKPHRLSLRSELFSDLVDEGLSCVSNSYVENLDSWAGCNRLCDKVDWCCESSASQVDSNRVDLIGLLGVISENLLSGFTLSPLWLLRSLPWFRNLGSNESVMMGKFASTNTSNT